MSLHLTLDRTARRPIFRQIYDGLRRAILDGRLRPGQRVPSTRSLAADLGVSRLPVLSAYEQLLHEGYLVGRIGSGTFVSRDLPDDVLRASSTGRLTPTPKRPATARARAVLNQPLPASWSLPVVPFQLGLPALDLFPSRRGHSSSRAMFGRRRPIAWRTATRPDCVAFASRWPSICERRGRFGVRRIRS